MTTPVRIQLRRTKGWRKPPGAIVVARPSRWGNPVSISNLLVVTVADGTITSSRAATAAEVVAEYRELVVDGDPSVPTVDEIRSALRGHDLACWCPLDQPCHADVLIEVANQ